MDIFVIMNNLKNKQMVASELLILLHSVRGYSIAATVFPSFFPYFPIAFYNCNESFSKTVAVSSLFHNAKVPRILMPPSGYF
jgi:hypothetical protein